MKILKKKHIVIYRDNTIICKSDSNTESFVPDGTNCAEFDTQDELEAYIIKNNLTE